MSDPLAYFRAREDPQIGAIFLASDPTLLRLCAAWGLIGVRFEAPSGIEPEEAPTTEAAAWDLLWQGCEVDEVALTVTAGADPDNYRYYMRTLIKTRLVYPDGTLPGFVRDAIERAAAHGNLPKGLG